MNIIYADSLFFLNFIIDYLILLAGGRICSQPLRRRRIALAAAAGGVYALLAVIRPAVFAPAPVKLLTGALLVLIAFGPHRLYLRTLLVFFAVSAAFAGAVYAARSLSGSGVSGHMYIPVSARVLVLSFAISYAVLTLVFSGSGRRAGRSLHRICIVLGGRSAELTALLDSGNELTDPMSGAPVVVAEGSALLPLFPACSGSQLSGDALAVFQTLSDCAPFKGGLRLIPCSCAAGGTSLLVCFTADSVTVDGVRRSAAVALSVNPLSADGTYQSLIPTALVP